MHGVLTLVLIGLVDGLITGISPCVLPVLPAVFMAGTNSRRPYLVVLGVALSFSVFTLLGTLIRSALQLLQGVIRWAGLGVLVLLGIGMIVPRFERLLERPFARIPTLRVRQNRGGGFVLGLALGAVYLPCAGPVLAAITVAAATGHTGVQVGADDAGQALTGSERVLLHLRVNARFGTTAHWTGPARGSTGHPDRSAG